MGARAAARLGSEPEAGSASSLLEWELYQDFARRIGEPIASMRKAEGEERDRLRTRWNRNGQRGQLIGWGLTLGSVVLMTVFTLGILLPLRRSLRTLRTTAGAHRARRLRRLAAAPWARTSWGCWRGP